MNLKRILIAGILSGTASFMVGSILYMNPVVAGVYEQFSKLPCYKSMDAFGGLGIWISLMFAGGLFSSIFLTALYSFTEKEIPLKTGWKKGLFFAFLVWLGFSLPTSFYSWLLYNYPDTQIMIEAFTGLIGGLVAGIVMGAVYEKVK